MSRTTTRRFRSYLVVLLCFSLGMPPQAICTPLQQTTVTASAVNVHCGDYRMPPGDSAYLDIQRFAPQKTTRDWFEVAYRNGYALWRVDFANVLLDWFHNENRQAQKTTDTPLVEVTLNFEMFQALYRLTARLRSDFESLGIKVSPDSKNGTKQVGVILGPNRVLRFHEGNMVIPGVAAAEPEAKAESVWLLGGSQGSRGPEIPAECVAALARNVTFNVTDRPLREVLEGLLRTAGLTATVDSGVQGNVTLYIAEKPLREVIEHLCKQHSLTWEFAGSFLMIQPAGNDQMKTLMVRLNDARAQDLSQILNQVKSPQASVMVDRNSNTLVIKENPDRIAQLKTVVEAFTRMNARDRVVTRLITLHHADATKIRTMLQHMLTPEAGHMEVDSRTNTLIVTEHESVLAKMLEITDRLDTAQKTSRIIPCQYVPAEDLKSTLNASLKEVLGVTSDSFLIESDKTTNSLIVTASPINLEKIEDFINQLDVRTRQVMIEARIVQVNLSRDENMGVNWNRLLEKGAEDIENSINLKNFAPVGDDNIGGLTYKVGTLSTDQLRVVLQALQRKDDSKVIANPTIVTTNRKKAFVNVETTIPVKRETVVATNTGPVTSITYDKQNVSVRLEVTPAINPDGYVAMEVNPKVQGLAGSVDNSQPIVSTKETNTNVIIRDGQTIVIAGLIEESTSHNQTNIPILGQVPLLKPFFRNRSTERRKTETIIFITPHIIDGSHIAEKGSHTAEM